MAALALGAAGAAGGGGDWTVLVPTAMAAEWTALTLPGGRARAPAAAGATAARGGSGGGGVPEVAIEMAALLSASGAAAGLGVGEGNGAMAYGGAGGSVPGHGAGGGLAEGGAGGRLADAGRPYFVPVVFVPSIKAKEEDKEKTAARIIYGLMLFGPLTLVIPVDNALHARKIDSSGMWQNFGFFWGIMSIGFHINLQGGWDHLSRGFMQHMAHFSLSLFCAFVIAFLYLLMPQSEISLLWLKHTEALLVCGHLMAWIGFVVGTTFTHEPSTGEALLGLSRLGWDGVKQGCQGVRLGWAKARDGRPRLWAKIQVCLGRKNKEERSTV